MNTCEELERITHRLNAKERDLLVSQEGVIHALLDCPMPMWLKDLDLNLLFINQAFTVVFGIELDVAQRQTRFETVGITQHRKNDLAVLAANRAITFTEDVKFSNGVRGTIKVIKYPVKIGGVKIGIAGLVLGVKKNV